MQTITGKFPVLGSTLTTSGSSAEYRRAGSDYSRTDIKAGSKRFLYSDVLNSLFNHSERVSTNFPGWNYFGAYGVKSVGEPTQVPPNKLLEAPKIRVNNKDFEKRSRKGAMIVSDYSNLTAMLSYNNGGIKTVRKSFLRPNYDSTRRPLAPGFSQPEKWGSMSYGNWSLRPESESLTVFFEYPYEEISITDELNPYMVGWSDEVIQTFINSFSFPEEIDALVISNSSDANSGTIDILTTIAEMPESARMVLDGFSSLRKLFSDAKAKKMRWLDKAKRVRFEAEERIFRINYDSRQEYLKARNERSRRLIEKKRLQEIKQVRDDTKKFLADITTAIAQVELTTRYGILPLVYTVEGFVETYDNLDMVYKRWSAKEIVNVEFPDVPGFKKSGTISVSLRAFIKRKFDQLKGALASLKHFTASLFRTAWELVPLSFVIDWFINVGDNLSNLFGSTLSGFTEAATISLKIENANCTYLHLDSGASVTVELKGYMRKVINPRDYCRLIWSPDVSGWRRFDAASLLWLKTRKLLNSLRK